MPAPVTAAEAREPMGMGKLQHVAAMFAMPRIASLWDREYNASPTEADIRRVYKPVEEGMLDVIGRYCEPIRGVVPAVAKMRQMGLPIGSCTGSPRSVGEKLAKKAELLGYVPEVLVCATDVPEGRPAPDICIKVLRLLGITNPAHVVKIGDTVNDVLEGVRAGMWVIGITLSGSLAGLSEEELNVLPDTKKDTLHERIAQELIAAGAHYTARDVASCLPILERLSRNAR